MNPKAYRLPKHVRPQQYSVTLKTSPERSDFAGRIQIDLETDQETTLIEMHARALTLSDAQIAGRVATVELDPPSEIVRFRFSEPLPAGKHSLTVAFAGELGKNMHGLYLATDGRAKAVCTQCEATDARAIFPCFDEPEFKARLAWTLETPDGLVALANGPLSKSNIEHDQRVSVFAPTPPVSSYLAAVTVGDFESSPEKVVNSIPLKVYAPRGKKAQTGFALEYTAKLLPWYEAYFAYRYPYTKYDQVAVPGFDAGAMENVGLVLFRQNLLLMDAKTASWRQEKLIAKVIAHEFAHMWFGNLVTMRWWDDLWLNEAFAEWMAHKAVDSVTPDYQVWRDFQDDKSRALRDDALPTTHPIWNPVETPEQALEMFDVITYQKGCAVMRMLENFLGSEPFQRGLQDYMQTFAGQNAEGKDLWAKLETSSGQPVAKLMQSWVRTSGFPLVTLELEGDTLQVSQRRFFSRPSKAPPDDTVWTVPLVVRFSDDEGDKTARFLFDKKEARFSLAAKGKVRFVYPNASEIGFYRSRLGPNAQAALLGAGISVLEGVEQMGMLEDQWSQVRSGDLTLEAFLPLLIAYTEGSAPAIRDHNVLRTFVDRLGALHRLLEDAGDSPAQARLRTLVARWLEPELKHNRLRPESADEPQNERQRRPLLYHALSRYADSATVHREAEKIADEESNHPESVDPNLAGVCIAISARSGDAARHGRWIELFRSRQRDSLPPQLVSRYLHTLSEFRAPALVEKNLGLLLDGTVPQESVGSVLGQLFAERHSQEAAWAHLKAEWPDLRKRVGDMGLSRVVEAVGALPARHRADIVAFFEQNPPAGAERALARALEHLDEYEELRQRLTPPLVAALSSSDPKP